MTRALGRPVVQSWLLAAAFGVLVLLSGSRDVFWTGDFFNESYSAYLAIILGREDLFFDVIPNHAGFATLVGAPSAFLTGLLDGRDTMVFRFAAVPGLVALGAVGVAVAAHARAAGVRAWTLYLLLGMGGAMTYQALREGHPEDPLACGLMLLGVFAALRGRTGWAGALLIAAAVFKPWAALGVLPAALAAPRGGARLALVAGAGAVLAILAQLLVVPDAARMLESTGEVITPQQLWWPAGVPASEGYRGAGLGDRMAPGWLGDVTRPVLVAVALAVPCAWWLRHRGARVRDDALLLLALVFLVRCLLDPVNAAYAHLPLVVALTAWEARRGRELPFLAVGVTAAAWLSFIVYREMEGAGPFLAYVVWAVPLAVGLGLALFRPVTLRRPVPATRPAPQPGAA